MASSNKKVAIPIGVRVRYLTTRWLKGLLFVASVAALGFLWMRRSPGIVIRGKVEAITFTVPASGDGILLAIDSPPAPFDRVEKNESLIARLDVTNELMEMQVLTEERARLQAVVDAEAQRLELQTWQTSLDLRGQELTFQRNLTSIRGQLDQLQREQNDLRQRQRSAEIRKAEIETVIASLEVDAKHLRNEKDRLVDLASRRLTPGYRVDQVADQITAKELEVADQRRLIQRIDQQLSEIVGESNEVAGRHAALVTSLQALQQRPTLDVSIDQPKSDLDISLAPLLNALKVHDSKVRQLATRIAANEIVAPVSGMISQVHFPPGTFVRSGDPIVTISSDQSEWIVAYVEPSLTGQLQPGAPLKVRIARDKPLIVDASVKELGTQVELMPEPLRRNAEVLQWGLPVKVAIPEGVNLLPGEMVDLLVPGTQQELF